MGKSETLVGDALSFLSGYRHRISFEGNYGNNNVSLNMTHYDRKENRKTRYKCRRLDVCIIYISSVNIQ